MATNPDRTPAGPSTPDERPGTAPEQKLAALPSYETDQPDPAQSSAARMGVASITVAAVAAAVILGVVLYGLNSTPPQPRAAVPATASSAPAAGGGPAPHASKSRS